MSKSTFNLEKAQFSDSDQQAAMQLPAALINNYSRQYSLIYEQLSVFLKECKENILKYISLNQFGVGFNIYNIFTHISKIQTTMLGRISDVQKQQIDHKKNLKNKYQKDFQYIIERMGAVIQDFSVLQVEFKKEYFGFNLALPNNNLLPRKTFGFGNSPPNEIGKIGSQYSRSSTQFLRKKIHSYSRQSEDKKQTEIQQKLRDILKKKLAPQKQNIMKFCDNESDPFKNLSKLQQKIDMMQSEIILSKTREEKIIQIFNKRRVQNIQPKCQDLTHCQLIQTDDGNRMKNLDEKYSSYNIINQNDKHGKSIEESLKDNNIRKNLGTSGNPSLDFQVINCLKYPQKYNQPTSSSTVYEPKMTGFSKKLISPKGFKSMKQPNSAAFNYFGSPKNQQFNKKVSLKCPTNCKKKKSQQNQQINPIFSQHGIRDQSIQKNSGNKIEENQDAVLLNSNINKNRSLFMGRRSNNQLLHHGDTNLIEKS